MATPPGPRADIGVIGGSGFYSFLSDAVTVKASTPYGPPSDPITVGELEGRRVAFLPRHGHDHRYAPHQVNYRANLWALRTLGVRQVIAPSAVGSLRPEIGPGALVVPDQVVDRTYGREHTFYDQPGPVVHVGFAHPYCPTGRRLTVESAGELGMHPVDGGTLVVINGPRFSSAAESTWHTAAGWSVVGMTGMPEAALARELALCYTSITVATDHDAGVQTGIAVSHQEVLRVFAENIERLRTLLTVLLPRLPADPSDCACSHALDGITLPFPLP
ncbi:MAG: S-methyl-5'-thioadenosine phosphorylase [Actinomycetes bacterium]